MKVKDLKKLLNGFDDNLSVVIASEPGGGNFSSVDSEIDKVRFKAFDGFGEIYIDNFTEEMSERGFVRDEFCDEKDTEKAIVLWPKG